MIKYFAPMCIATFLVLGASEGFAQKTTEIFIPVGKSPGVSGKYSIVGKIETVTASNRNFTIASSSGNHIITVKSDTKIWLDRSKLQERNIAGDFGDLKQGFTVEVKFKDETRKGDVEWVKVQLTASPDR